MKTILTVLKLFTLSLIFFTKSAYAFDCTQGISGYIKDPRGNPISGAVVTVLVNGSNYSTPVSSRENGSFIRPGPMSGNISILVVKSGYLFSTTTVIESCSDNVINMNPDNVPTSPPGREPRCTTTCATSAQCEQATDGCSLCFGNICINPNSVPSPTPFQTPVTKSTDGINFNVIGQEMIKSFPNINRKLLGGANEVYPILSDVLKYVYVFAGLLLLFYLIAGGFHMMIAAKDEKGLVEAKGKITNALVGFLLLFVSYWIVQIMEYILGIKIF